MWRNTKSKCFDLINNKKYFSIFPLTPQTDGLEESDAGAEAEVEQVVLGAGGDGLALVAVVIHVEALAAGNRQ